MFIQPSTDDPKPLWAMEIGLGVLAFGSIELLVNQAGQLLPVRKADKAFTKLTLSERTELLVEALRGSGHAWEPSLIPWLTELDAHRPIRNVLAHEPMLLDLFYNERTEEVAVQVKIYSPRNGGTTILFEDLVHWRQRAQAIALEMTHIVYPSAGKA